MAKGRIKLIWGGAKQVPGHWRLGLWGVYSREVGSRPRIAVSIRGVLLWCAGLAVAGYFVGATALYVWFARNPYNLVTWADTVLIPVRWDDVREKRGRMMIEEGLNDYRERRWAQAHMKLRVGLSRAPRDIRARMTLADFYTMANRRPNAVTVLTEGLKYGYPGKAYLTKLFALALEGEEHELVNDACDQLMAQAGGDREWLLARKMQALLGLGRPEEVLQLAEAEGEMAGALIRESRVLALLELERETEALSFLDRWREEIPGHRAQILRLQVRAYREAGRHEEMDTAWRQLRQLAPTDPRTYVYGVVQTALMGNVREAEEELSRYFLRFGGSVQNMILMTRALVEAKQRALVESCVDRAAQHGFPRGPFKLSLAQVQLESGDCAAALQTLADLKQLGGKQSVMENFLTTWMERLAAVAVQADGAPAAALVELFQQRRLPMRLQRVTGEVLIEAGRYETAQRILNLAERAYPASRTLAELRTRVDEALQAQVVPVAKAEPGPAPVKEEAFFARMAELEAEQRWSEAAQEVRAIRVAKPEWLSRRQFDVLDLQMRVAVRTGDMPELLASARLFLDGNLPRAVRVCALAGQLGSDGRVTDGERLLREVFRRHPDFPPALRLQKEWAEREKAAAEAAKG